MPGMKWIEPIVFFFQKIWKPHLGHIFDHQRDKIDGRNMKIKRDQETHVIKVNNSCEMNWAILFLFLCVFVCLSKNPEIPFLGKYLASRLTVGMLMLTRCHWQCLDRLSQIFATLCKACFYVWFPIENEVNAGNFCPGLHHWALLSVQFRCFSKKIDYFGN